jgi:cupin superfamily acireductone dioxygenase involved in methionine salvage
VYRLNHNVTCCKEDLIQSIYIQNKEIKNVEDLIQMKKEKINELMEEKEFNVEDLVYIKLEEDSGLRHRRPQ